MQRTQLPPALFVDPGDNSGHASDTNSGTTAARPFRTTQKLNDTLFQSVLTANTTITYLSDDNDTVGIDLSSIDCVGFNLDVIAATIVVHTGGTLSVGTVAIDPTTAGGGQRQTAAASDLTDFSPFVFSALGGPATNPVRIINTGTNDSAWIASGTSIASISQPVSADALSAGTMAIGASYELVRGSLVALAAAPAPVSSGGVVTLQGFTFTAASAGPFSQVGATPAGNERVVFKHCAFLGPMMLSGLYRNCFFASGGQGDFLATLSTGLFITVDEMTGVINFQDAVYVTGPSGMIFGGTFINSAFVSPGSISNSGIQLQDSSALAALIIGPGSEVTLTGLIWGNGNANFGILIAAGSSFTVPQGHMPSATGASGDFGFLDNGGTHATARAWDDTASAYTAPRNCTWANLSATIAAGGFDGNAHFLPSDGHLVTAAL